MNALKKLCRSCGVHKLHLKKLLLNTDALFETQPHDKLQSEDRAHLENYLKQYHKATVFRDTDKNILDNLEDEHEFETIIVESEEMYCSWSCHKEMQ